jgi:hypothetical protein
MRNLLAIIIMGSLLGAAVWDLAVLAAGHSADQISRIILSWSRALPILPLLVGILLGHLFWPQPPE